MTHSYNYSINNILRLAFFAPHQETKGGLMLQLLSSLICWGGTFITNLDRDPALLQRHGGPEAMDIISRRVLPKLLGANLSVI